MANIQRIAGNTHHRFADCVANTYHFVLPFFPLSFLCGLPLNPNSQTNFGGGGTQSDLAVSISD